MIRRRLQAHIPDIGAILVLAVLPMLVFWRIWAANPDDRVMFAGDILMGAYPTRVFVHQLLGMGDLPLWNPYQLGGMPLIGDIQVAPYYLPNYALEWFFRGKDITYLGFELLVVAHYVLGALGMYAYLRQMKLQVAAALVGAIAFEFNGFFIGHRGHYNMLAVAAWLPTVLCLFDCAWAAVTPRRALAWTILAGLALSQMIMAGHPQATLYCSTLLGAYGMWRWVLALRAARQASPDPDLELPTTRIGRLMAGVRALLGKLEVPITLVIGGAIAFGISASALLPAFELLSRSLRSTPTYEFSSQYSLLPRNLIGLLIPELLGWSGTEFRIYAGVITLVLTAAALVVPNTSRPERSFFAAATVIALLVAVGGFTMMQGFIYRFLPGFTSVRVSSRAFFIANLSLAVLAAIGADTLFRALADEELKRLRTLVRSLAGIIGVAALGGAALYVLLAQNYQPVGEDFFFAENLFSQTPAKDAFGLLTQVTNQYLIFILLLIAAVMVLSARSTGRLSRNALMVAAVLVTIIDLGTYAPYHDTIKADPEKIQISVRKYATKILTAWWQRQDQQQLIAQLAQLPDGVRVDNSAEDLPDNYSQMWRTAFATGYNILDIKERFSLLTRWPNLPQGTRWDLMGVGYVMTAPDDDNPPEPDAKLVLANSQGKLWRRAQQPPYARFSTSIRPSDTSLTVNALLMLPGQTLNSKPAVDMTDVKLRAILAERWPALVEGPLYKIGKTDVRSPVEIGVLAGGAKYGAVMVEGKTVTPERRGIVMALIDPQTGKVLSADGYDTYQLASESDRLAVTIQAAKAGTIIALATYDEGTAQLTESARTALASIGANEQLRKAFGKAYGLIGVKGAAPGTALEQLSDKPVTLDVGIGAGMSDPVENFHASLVRYQQDQIILVAQNNVPGLLTISETYYPGWVAYVDGIETPILRANGMQRAIVLAPTINGKPHEISFVYRPMSFRIGTALARFTLVLALGILAALGISGLPGRLRFPAPVPAT